MIYGYICRICSNFMINCSDNSKMLYSKMLEKLFSSTLQLKKNFLKGQKLECFFRILREIIIHFVAILNHWYPDWLIRFITDFVSYNFTRLS